MIDKRVSGAAEAVGHVHDGATVMISGFGEAGSPTELIHALIDQGARDLVVVNNNAGNGHIGLAALLAAGRVRKMICSYPRSSHSFVFTELYQAGRIELEVVAQGTLAERIRAAGAGIPAFFTPTAAGSEISRGKEVRDYRGRPHVLEDALFADLALIKAECADRWGNLTYNKSARNFAPIMATAARVTVAQVRRTVALGEIDPETVVTPGVYLDRIVCVENPVSESDHLDELGRPSWRQAGL
ncbi:3-oxoadipate CoA-transferase subunit A [Brevundimonas sp. NIBR10]|uniref:3-oxoacid CoA-transferase subunit A n=1 Tax=Brevundimonas sp. NIBR10 TaxID=3015997 RepID=UPI0022F1C66A|nr:3-oxoacid CoA-transferase subunit A [Brevundimonas sp. NIBR10]WGM45932.1 3-oxoadipate CoA-transferase subunit A [Brevundimonas sp. NIBR10]